MILLSLFATKQCELTGNDRRFKQIRFISSWIVYTLLISSCMKSPPPQVSDLIKIKPPTFSGLSEKSFTVPSQVNIFNGECDPMTRLLQYNLDGGAWKDFGTDCKT